MHLKFQYTLFISFLIILMPRFIQPNKCISENMTVMIFCKKGSHKINLLGDKYDLDCLKLKRIYIGSNIQFS